MIKHVLALWAFVAFTVPVPAGALSHLSKSEKRAIVRNVLTQELGGKGMSRQGAIIYLSTENINPDWLRGLLSRRLVLLTPDEIKEDTTRKALRYIRFDEFEIQRTRVRITIHGFGEGITYEYRKGVGKWVGRPIKGYGTAV